MTVVPIVSLPAFIFYLLIYRFTDDLRISPNIFSATMPAGSSREPAEGKTATTRLENAFFFTNNGYRIFGVLHEARKSVPSLAERLGFVFCNPFAEEKMIAHRTMVSLARGLSEKGYPVLRFDYMGSGDSEGNFEDSTVETMLSDLRCAVDLLSNQTSVDSVALLGVRLGGTLAALACGDAAPVNRLIMVAPIINGKEYMDQCLRSNLTTQMVLYKRIVKDRSALIKDLMDGGTANIDGYLLSGAMYRQLKDIDLLSGPLPNARNILLVHISGRTRPSRDDKLAGLHEKYTTDNTDVQFQIVQEDKFYQDLKTYRPYLVNIEKAVVEWIAATTEDIK